MDADLGATDAAEEGLRLIGASAIGGAIFNLMIDALYWEVGSELIPMRGFVCVDGRAGCNRFARKGNASRFGLGNGRDCAAMALAGDDDNLALASLVLSKTAVLAIFFAVLWADVAAKVGAIKLNVTLQGAFVAGKLMASRTLCNKTKALL